MFEFGDGWRWLEMAGDVWKWLEVAGDGWRWLEMAEDGWRWLESFLQILFTAFENTQNSSTHCTHALHVNNFFSYRLISLVLWTFYS